MFLVQFCKSLHFNLINGTYKFRHSNINEPIEFAGCYDPRAGRSVTMNFFHRDLARPSASLFGSKASALRTSGLIMGIVFGALLPSPDSASLFCLRWYHSRRGSVDLSLQQIKHSRHRSLKLLLCTQQIDNICFHCSQFPQTHLSHTLYVLFIKMFSFYINTCAV